MGKRSAGIVLYRRRHTGVEFLLVHPGGPYWTGKEQGAWSIPKGEYGGDEDPLGAARREVDEELGVRPEGDFIALTPVRQKAGKVVTAWATEADLDPAEIRSNTFTTEWPPRSGRLQEFPEVDRARWVSLEEASVLINPAQLPLLEELTALLGLS